MSIWQFNSAVKGYVKANTANDPKKFSSEEEKDEMWDWLASKEKKQSKILSNIMYLWDGIQFTVEKRVQFEV